MVDCDGVDLLEFVICIVIYYVFIFLFVVMQTVLLTTRIDTSVVDIIKQFAKSANITQRQVIEEAVRLFALQKKKHAIQTSFARIANDPDTIALADTDMSEFLDSYHA